MVNKKFWLGILVLALVFAMVGCDNNPTDDSGGPTDDPTALGEETILSGKVYKEDGTLYNGNLLIVYSPSGGETGNISGNGDFTIILGKPSDSFLADLDAEFFEKHFSLLGDFETPDISETDVKIGAVSYFSGSNSPNTSYSLSRGLDSGRESNTSINYISQSLMYVYVDKDVTISATGKTPQETQETQETEDGAKISTHTKYTTRDCSLVLVAGWNTVLYQWQMDGNVTMTTEETKVDMSYTYSFSIRNPSNLKWFLIEDSDNSEE